MTKAELIKNLEPYSDDMEIIIDFWVNEEVNHVGDIDVVGLSQSCDDEEENLICLTCSGPDE